MLRYPLQKSRHLPKSLCFNGHSIISKGSQPSRKYGITRVLKKVSLGIKKNKNPLYPYYNKSEDTKEVIRSHKAKKDRQYKRKRQEIKHDIPLVLQCRKWYIRPF